MLLERRVLDSNVYFHHAVRPYNKADLQRLDSNWSAKNAYDTKAYWSKTRTGRWLNKKLFNESFVIVKGEDYRIEVNPILNLELGVSNEASSRFPFLNSRGVWVEGSLGKQFSFYTMIAENLGRFPNHYNFYYQDRFSVLGWGKLNQVSSSGVLDFPMVMGGICYKPSKYFTFSLSQGKQFFGEGYRSMILSDNATPNANFKIETDFAEKVKYVNLYSIYLDPRGAVAVNGYDLRKYTSFHYLSWNISPKFNLSFFESLVWVGDTSNPNQGFDPHFLNPIIMYRQVEKVVGGKGGNAMIGLTASYQPKRHLRIYSQLAIDDFSVASLGQLNEGHWLNFFSGQLGVKVIDPWGLKNLFLQLEYNSARPFMYAHRNAETNYTHSLLPLAHPWGASFREFVLRLNYQQNRWVEDVSFSYGEAADDPEGRNLGNNLFNSIFDRQGQVLGFNIAQGNSYNLMSGQLRLAYVLNARTMTRLELGYRFRYQLFRSKEYEDRNLQWWFLGLRTPLFEAYRDF